MSDPNHSPFTPLNALTDEDRIIHAPARLAIMSCLAVVESADFLFLLRQTGLTKGNLSSHLSKLEEAGFVEITKEFLKKTPHTLLSLSEKGQKAFQDYQARMSAILKGSAE
ncbi:MAG: transcriptional regulator [Candidatus Marinimicrobia bacterium]|nr:transcriptional regulator [Candidatus Neomarinimicrobiota bacterium]MCF7921980.1 transcriptional regulator [Candidatus Neomarinimicrobiota bacterium]